MVGGGGSSNSGGGGGSDGGGGSSACAGGGWHVGGAARGGDGPGWLLLDARTAGGTAGSAACSSAQARRVEMAHKIGRRRFAVCALLSALSCFYSTSEALYAGQLLVLTAATSGC